MSSTLSSVSTLVVANLSSCLLKFSKRKRWL